MVELKSNLLTIAIIIGFTVLLAFFAVNFANQTEKSSNVVIREVNKTTDEIRFVAENLTSVISDLVNLKSQELQTFRSGFDNLTTIMYQQVNMTQQDREEQAKNLQLFLDTFGNQSKDMVTAINELNKDGNASREQQTQKFVETLEQSQNLTRANAALSLERNEIEKNQTDRVEDLIQTLNLTLTFPSSLSNKTIQ